MCFKISISLGLALLTTFFSMVMKISFSNELFIVILLISVIFDTLLGVIISFKKKNFSSTKFSDLFIKLFIYLGLIIIANLISNYTVDGRRNIFFAWLNNAIYALLIVREMISIFEKTTILGVFTPPQWLLDKLDIYDSEKKQLKK